MCLSISEITFCGGCCKISGGGSPIAIQTNGCAHFARGGASPVCDRVLNGNARLVSTLSFPEVWCVEHQRFAPDIRCGRIPSSAPRKLYRSVDEWISLRSFAKADGYEVLRCQLLYQADLKKYVANSVKTMMAKMASGPSGSVTGGTPRVQKRKLEESPRDMSDDASGGGKRVKLAPTAKMGGNVAHQRGLTEATLDASATVLKGEATPALDFVGSLDGGREVFDVPDFTDDALWGTNPLDTMDDKQLQELFGFDDTELNNLDIAELFPSG